MCKPTVVCLTPVKNEAHILDRFLMCASMWSDRIIIADQQSDDGSREIAKRYSKVTLLDNFSPSFNEAERQKLLLDAARRIPGPRLLVALDADECLSFNFMESEEWQALKNAPCGTIGLFQRVGLLPGLKSCWLEGKGFWFPFAFMDDGSEHNGRDIHSERVPIPSSGLTFKLQDVKVLHYQYANWKRMESKHRWYQCWERLNHPSKRAIDIYRQYHHMDAITIKEKMTIHRDWIAGYEQKGVEMSRIRTDAVYRWDRELLALFAEYGTAAFRREAIWDKNWKALSLSLQFDVLPSDVHDPRTFMDKLVHIWLRRSQRLASTFPVRCVDKWLSYVGW